MKLHFLILFLTIKTVLSIDSSSSLSTNSSISDVQEATLNTYDVRIFDVQAFYDRNINGTLKNGKINILYRQLSKKDQLDFSQITLKIPHPEKYIHYGNDSIIEMTVSNGHETILINLPVVYDDGQLGWSDGKVLNPVIMQSSDLADNRGPNHNKNLVITLQSVLNVDIDYEIHQNVLDKSQYFIRFPEGSSILRIDDQNLTFDKPIGFYVNAAEQNISNLKLTITSKDDFCATLVTVPHNISIYERSDALDKIERRITFTRRADIYVSENELKEFPEFRIFVFVNPNDDECDPDAIQRKHQDQRKTLSFEFQKIDTIDYLLPIMTMLGVFLLPALVFAGSSYYSIKSENDVSLVNLIELDDSLDLEDNLLLPATEEETTLKLHEKVLNFPLAVVLPIFMHISVEYHKFTTTSMANLDEICFHNHACAKPFWEFRAFNNIISNIGYLIFGALFVLLSLKRRYWTLQAKGCGIYESVLLDVTIGLFLMMQAVASATYHICPSDVAIQFDTPCIQVICGLLIIRQWSIRHHTPSPSYSNSLFVAVFCANFIISAFSKSSMTRVFIGAAHIFATYMFVKAKGSVLKNDYKYATSFFASSFGALNFLLILVYSSFTQLIHLNQIVTFTMIINCAAYLIYYTLMKISNDERTVWQAEIVGVLAVISWLFAIFYYLQDDIDWTITPAKSRALNKPCILFDFFGSHDLWHVFSGFATLFTLLYVSHVDDDLENVSKKSLNGF